MELNREEIKEIANAALTLGQTMLESGAETGLVEEDMEKLALTLGCDHANLMVMPQTIAVTLTSGHEFRTMMRHVGGYSPNMQKLSIAHKIAAKSDIAIDITLQLESLRAQKKIYLPFTLIFAAALACAAFCALFGGSGIEFVAAFISAFFAAYTKYSLEKVSINPLFALCCAAFAATFIGGIFETAGFLHDGKIVQAAAILQFVPGVQLINSFEDMIKGHFLSGVARGLRGMLVSFGIVAGVVLAINALKLF